MARVKYNIDTINSQLSKTSHAINNLGFTWGNQQAQNEIALYVSLSCIYCNKAIQELSWLIDIYPDFRYRIIIDSESNIDNYNNRFIYQLHYVKNKDAFFNILSNKYDEQTEQFNLSEIGKTNPLTADKLQNINSTIEFCKNIQINYFPAFFINGKLLTNIYDYSDLLGIIRTLS